MKIPDNFIKFFDKYLNKDAYSKIFGAKIQIVYCLKIYLARFARNVVKWDFFKEFSYAMSNNFLEAREVGKSPKLSPDAIQYTLVVVAISVDIPSR